MAQDLEGGRGGKDCGEVCISSMKILIITIDFTKLLLLRRQCCTSTR